MHMQLFDTTAQQQHPATGRWLSTIYSQPRFVEAVAPVQQPAKAYSHHAEGQPWGPGPFPFSKELLARYKSFTWSGAAQSIVNQMTRCLGAAPI